MLRRAAAYDFAHSVLRIPEFAGDRENRLTLSKSHPAYLRNRLRYQHPRRHASQTAKTVANIADSHSKGRVTFGRRFPRKRVALARRSTARPGEGLSGDDILEHASGAFPPEALDLSGDVLVRC